MSVWLTGLSGFLIGHVIAEMLGAIACIGNQRKIKIPIALNVVSGVGFAILMINIFN